MKKQEIIDFVEEKLTVIAAKMERSVVAVNNRMQECDDKNWEDTTQVEIKKQRIFKAYHSLFETLKGYGL